MEPLAFRVKDYKCIEDSGWVELEDLTCLIGKNQSGKTAFLNAIEKLNSARNNSEYEPFEEYPRERYSEYELRHEDDPDIVVQARFELSNSEVEMIEQEMGNVVLENNEVELLKNYKNELSWHLNINEKEYIQNLISEHDLHPKTEKSLKDATTFSELASKIEESDSSDEDLQILSETISRDGSSLSQEIGSDFLQSEIPQFLYLGEYHFLNDELSMKQLINRIDNNDLGEGDEIFLSLLSLANLEPEELQQEENFKKVRTRLEAAAKRVTNNVMEYWSQNENIKITFDRNYVPSTGIFSYDNEYIVEVLVENLDHGAQIPFDQQSRGFKWFFSAFCEFTDFKGKDDLVILLDEPGLHLHARAQQDFLDFMNAELSEEHTVIYTSHSPFMLDPRKLYQAKLVQSDSNNGTTISTDVMRTDEETLIPMQNVFEFDLIDTLLIRPQTLLVEGKSDHSYIYSMSEILEEKGREGLARQWTVIPVGSGSNVPTFVSLFGGNDLDLGVLIDGDGHADQRKEQIMSKDLMDENHIKKITDFISADYGDIEDLFSTDDYLMLVNARYRREIEDSHTTYPIEFSDFKRDSQEEPRITKGIDQHFSRQGINNGELNHAAPAEYFENNRTGLKDKLDDETLENFECLFQTFNEILREFEEPSPEST